MRLKPNLAADAALILTTVLWGTTFVVTKDLLDYWPPLSFLALRFTVSAVLLAALFPRKLVTARPKVWRAGMTLGVLLGLAISIQSTGLIYTTPSKSAFITGLTTPLVPFVALALFRVRPNMENIVGIVLASIGGLLILMPSEGSVNQGDLITLGCLLLFATHVNFLSVYTKRFDIGQLTVIQIICAAVVVVVLWLATQLMARVLPANTLPVVVVRETAQLVWSGRVVWQLLYMSAVATVVTFLLWAWGQSRMSATHAAVIFSLEPVFATLFAVMLKGRNQWAGGRSRAGAALILAGVIFSELRLRDRPGTVQSGDDGEDIPIESFNLTEE